MSRRIVWLVAMLHTSLVSAQQTPEPRTAAEIARHIDEMVPRYEAARIALENALARQRAEEAREAHPTVDTIAVGPLHVVTPPDQVDLAARLFSEVWRESFANVTGSPELQRRFFTFQWKLSPEPIYMAEVLDAPVSDIWLSRFRVRTQAAVKERLRFEIAYALVEDFDRRSALGAWLSGVRASDLDSDVAYRELALGASLGGPYRACLEGDVEACWTMNVLDAPDPHAALTDAFTHGEKQAIVARVYSLLNAMQREQVERVGGSAQMVTCLEARTDEACPDALGRDIEGYVRELLTGGSNSLRWTLFFHAVALGGEGAWERALALADAPASEMLTTVSDMDRRGLTASWLAILEEARPVHAAFGGARWTVFCWILIFLALASRSTRWRLG